MVNKLNTLVLAKVALAVLLVACPGKRVWAQESPFASIQNSFAQYQPKVLKEKLFLHLDKNLYLAGETLWFKVYAVEGTTHSQIDFSKVAYIEILDRDQKPVLQTKVALTQGAGHGSVVLPMALTSDQYKIRAYTLWMKNFSPDFYFERPLTIVNTEATALAARANEEKEALDIQFFPEGGNLVQGLESKVGVRAVNAQGKGIEFSGAIINERKDTLVRFSPLTFGIGSFFFKPEGGVKYKAVIRPLGQKPQVLELPRIYEQGFTLSISETGNAQVKVNVNTTAKSGQQQVFLFAHTRQVQKVANAITLREGQGSVTLSKADLGDGITHFTLFDDIRQPVCERLYFKPPTNVLQLAVQPDAGTYSSRQKTTVSVAAQNAIGAPVEANLSVGVYLLDSLQGQNQHDLLSYFWLASDLKGTIESPGYYFTTTHPDRAKALDNLMLTHGWRRFKWEEVLQNKTPALPYAPELEGMSLTVQVGDKTSNAPVGRVLTFLSLPDSVAQFYGGVTNSAGKIRFNLTDFYGKKEIVVRTGEQKENLHQSTFANPFSESFTTSKLPNLQLAAAWQEPLVAQSLYHQVRRYYQPQAAQQFAPTATQKGSSFYGTPDKQYLLAEYTKFPTLADVFREYIPEVLLQKREGVSHLLVLDKRRQSHFGSNPLILLDGVPFFRIEEIVAYNPAQIKKIEVVTHKYFLGTMAFNGIVSISTYKADLSGFALDPNVLIFDYEGLQRQREFYSPVYETAQQKTSPAPDFRNLLHWSPNLTTTGGKTQFSFFTSDMKGKYLGVVQGMTKSGAMGVQTFVIEVRNPL